MIIVLKPNALKSDAKKIVQIIEKQGLKPLYLPGVERVVIGALGDERKLSSIDFKAFPFVDDVKPVLTPYKQVSREFHPHNTEIMLGSQGIGGQNITIIAGPCSVESHDQLLNTVTAVKEQGAVAFRAGAYKPRTSPYSFQGLGDTGLELIAAVREVTGLPAVTEVMSVEQLEKSLSVVDMVQIGARNMQNFELLKAVGEIDRPVLLKRGLSATLEEFLLAAEYIVSQGNPNVVLCERGIRTFEKAYRNVLDLNAVVWLKQRSHLPVFVDPSHGTGRADMVTPMACAAVAAGADGLLIEVHPEPSSALSDASQQLSFDVFASLMARVDAVANAVGRSR
ncbi:MAG: 3-deoxy-7-phosphoheptulonate synthase [Gammaproteobacteria bacterium]|nr:MAG: 3-deoxy-7-phosphoheptulonate synthase [Gammaproteobacteria bacterium]